MPSTVPDIFNNESEEEMRLQTRAKLFELVDKQWRDFFSIHVKFLPHAYCGCMD